MNGFVGDSNHYNFMGKCNEGHEHCKFMGQIIAEAVRDMWDNTLDREDAPISSEIEIVYNKTRCDNIEYYEDCVKLYATKDTTKTTPTGISYPEAGRIISAVEIAPLFQKIPATVITIGDVAIVGLGGEAFTNYAEDVRQMCPDKFILTSCCTNGHEGYLPTTTAFKQGGYEVVTSPFSSTIEEDCMKTIKKLMK